MPTRRRRDDYLPGVPNDVLMGTGQGSLSVPYDRADPMAGNAGGAPAPDAGAAAAVPPSPSGPTLGLAGLGGAGGAGGLGGLPQLADAGAGGQSTDALSNTDLEQLMNSPDISPEERQMIEQVIMEAARRNLAAG